MKNFILLLGLFVLFFGCTSNTNTQQTGNSQVQIQAPVQPVPAEEETTMNPNPVKKGDFVSADYIGTLDDGKVFDTSIKEEALKAGLAKQSYAPLQFLVGEGRLIDGFENALIGMKEGENKTVHLTPEEAYGEPIDEFIITVNKTQLPEEMQKSKINVGAQITASDGRPGIVIETTSTNITVDFNNPLAGKNLTFTIFLRKILN